VEESVTAGDAWTDRLASGWLFWPACLVGVILVALAMLGPEAERRIAVEYQCVAMQNETSALKATRDQLAAAEKALQTDPAYTERIVRHELGLVRPGETRLPHRVKPQDIPDEHPPPPARAQVPPMTEYVALFGDGRLRFLAMTVGATLLACGILFSLPGKRQVQR
jgi:cell division protein FtsB